LFVYQFLVARYQSWTVPTSVILSVVIAGAGGLAATWAMGLDNNVDTRIGLMMLIKGSGSTAPPASTPAASTPAASTPAAYTPAVSTSAET
jgi:hypothetical protein